MAYSATNGLMSTASAAAAIAQDPYLPEVTELILKLQSLEKKRAGAPSSGPSQGVGLRNVVGPLRAFVKIQEKPWILPAVSIGIVGSIFVAGYFIGKGK